MTDMRSVIAPKSDQLNADDMISGPMTITISGVKLTPGAEQPVSISFNGDGGKPWRPCKSMSRVLVSAWGPDANVYAGKSLTLYRDPAVTWGGMAVGGIRISHMSHIEKDLMLMLTMTKKSRAPHMVKKLIVADILAPAREAANRGTIAFRAWWSDASPDARTAVKTDMDALKAACAAADKAMTEADPFGPPEIPEDDAAPTAEEQARYDADEQMRAAE